MTESGKEKILLALLPFWTPLIPPQGLARLKGFLQRRGYRVKTVDANLENGFKQLYDRYFNTLKEFVPREKWGNFYNIGNDVWREHMMAHLHRRDIDEARYMNLVNILAQRIFYQPLNDDQAGRLNGILTEFYARLEDYFLALLEREQPDVLGLSVYRDTLGASLFAFGLTRERFPHIKTVMGGGVFTIQLPLGSPNLDYFLQRTRAYIDKIIVGEGEGLLLKYLRGELPEERRLFTGKDLADGERVGFAPVDMFDFSDFNPGNYNYQAAQASTGCPNKCSFCNVASFYGDYREKDAVQTVNEMTELHRQNGIRLFYMLDALLNPVIDRLAGEFIKRDIALYWDGYFRVDGAVDMEKALAWRRGGFYRARIGVESGSQKILDLMGKAITVDQVRTTISSLAYAGVKTTAYIVIGHPGETEADFCQTLDLITELKNDLWEVECNPFTYIYSGQGSADQWANDRQLLYPSWAKELLISQTWFVDGSPTREEMYDRVYRFAGHCRRLGVSTPWTLNGVDKSDRRWKTLHKNAVPPVLELIRKNTAVDECKRVEQLSFAVNTAVDAGDDDFDF
jgi:hypothetical protein